MKCCDECVLLDHVSHHFLTHQQKPEEAPFLLLPCQQAGCKDAVAVVTDVNRKSKESDSPGYWLLLIDFCGNARQLPPAGWRDDYRLFIIK